MGALRSADITLKAGVEKLLGKGKSAKVVKDMQKAALSSTMRIVRCFTGGEV